jgi:hypothetical protein
MAQELATIDTVIEIYRQDGEEVEASGKNEGEW